MFIAKSCQAISSTQACSVAAINTLVCSSLGGFCSLLVPFREFQQAALSNGQLKLWFKTMIDMTWTVDCCRQIYHKTYRSSWWLNSFSDWDAWCWVLNPKGWSSNPVDSVVQMVVFLESFLEIWLWLVHGTSQLHANPWQMSFVLATSR